jgi:hypothetical protein
MYRYTCSLPQLKRTRLASCDPKFAEKLPFASAKSFWAITSRTLHDAVACSPRSTHETLIVWLPWSCRLSSPSAIEPSCILRLKACAVIVTLVSLCPSCGTIALMFFVNTSFGAWAAGSWCTRKISRLSNILKQSGWSEGRVRRSDDMMIWLAMSAHTANWAWYSFCFMCALDGQLPGVVALQLVSPLPKLHVCTERDKRRSNVSNYCTVYTIHCSSNSSLQTHLQHVAVAEETRTINIRLRPQL